MLFKKLISHFSQYIYNLEILVNHNLADKIYANIEA